MMDMEYFSSARQIIFFTGAGISAESGISTFRAPDGFWEQHDPMKLASPQGFVADPDLVLAWYAARRKVISQSSPNNAHLSITKMQKLFPESLVITQNVDGLHQQAGNHPVMELHGSIHHQKCSVCDQALGMVSDLNAPQTCPCGGLARPDVVWFGESLPANILSAAFDAAERTDVCFVVGTSSLVYPAAHLPLIVQRAGGIVIEINREETPLSAQADVSLRGLAGEILPKIHEEIYASFQAMR